MSTLLPAVPVLGAAADVKRLLEILDAGPRSSAFALHQGWAETGTPSLVLLAGASGQDELRSVLARVPAARVVVVGADSAALASASLRGGASEYLSWETITGSAAQLEDLFRTLLSSATPAPILRSAAAGNVYRLARRVAPSDVPVLIHGDSGSGKEVLARFVHQQSLRSDGPFVAVNCAAIPENMLEATLFGHEKGAFTGADRKREGKFVTASEGTLLLDEITEMPVELQAKLLRAIQECEIEPLGARDACPTNVRIIATSNRDLKQAIEQGRLRLDLYYRLNVFPLQLPTLAQRCEDILPLAELIAERHRPTPGSSTTAIFDDEAQAAMLRHDWPGNVRELENRIQRALILCDQARISVTDLGLQAEANAPGPRSGEASTRANLPSGDFKSQLNAQEGALILEALDRHGGQRKATAAALGISERTLRYRLQRMRDSGVSVT